MTLRDILIVAAIVLWLLPPAVMMLTRMTVGWP